MHTKKLIATLAALAAVATLTAGCVEKEGPMERAGKQVDKTVEKAGQKIEDAGDKIKDATKK